LREVGAGIGIVANALRALDALGLGVAIRSRGLAGTQGCLRNSKGEVLVSIPGGELTKQVGAIAVLHRAELLSLLGQHVDPSRLHLDHECIGLEQDGGRVTVQFHNGETAQGDLLIGADGLRSAVRTVLWGNRPVRYAGYTAWRSVVRFELTQDTHKLVAGETWGRGCRFGIVPMSGGRVYWFATRNAVEDDRSPDGQTKKVLFQLFGGWHEPIEALIAAADETSILRNDIYDIDPFPRWTRGRVTLLGDAAHPMTPNLGQGACQAIEDAVVLAVCLKQHTIVESALLAYERRRIPRTKQFVLQSRRLGVIAQFENPVLCLARDAAMRAVPKGLAARQMKSLLGVETLTASERALFASRP
jgi:2-polyprenyl-6-methoxyphenol hydroxylase-like FAD-dependent oxidoreductase